MHIRARALGNTGFGPSAVALIGIQFSTSMYYFSRYGAPSNEEYNLPWRSSERNRVSGLEALVADVEVVARGRLGAANLRSKSVA